MRVRATAQGYLDGFREVGAEFDVPDGFKGPWFTPIDLPVKPEEVVEEKKTSRRKSY